jgi:hypothetical protein
LRLKAANVGVNPDYPNIREDYIRSFKVHALASRGCLICYLELTHLSPAKVGEGTKIMAE